MNTFPFSALHAPPCERALRFRGDQRTNPIAARRHTHCAFRETAQAPQLEVPAAYEPMAFAARLAAAACQAMDSTWKQRKTKLDTFNLFGCLFSRLGLAQRMDRVSMPVAGVTGAAVSAALSRLPADTFRRVFHAVQTVIPPAYNPRVFAIDGSKIHVPQCLRREGFVTNWHNQRCQRPLGLLSCLVDVETRRVLDYRWTPQLDERQHAKQLMASLPRGSVLIADRGYYSAQLVRCALRHGVHVVFRVRKNATGEIQRWVRAGARGELKVSLGRCFGKVIHFRAKGSDFYCLTDLTHLSGSAVADLYKTRWQVETFYRCIKSTLHLRNVRVSSAAKFAHYVDATMLGHLILLWGAYSPDSGVSPELPCFPPRPRLQHGTNALRADLAKLRDALIFIFLGCDPLRAARVLATDWFPGQWPLGREGAGVGS
mmetsp:Transcript_29509/g.96376  ORF Transcript_29509/g.96376 Transcript_29509/m.96376 type:complete len:429 (+) Transcript_29509:1105-2391(+)